MTRTFTNIGDNDIAIVILGTDHGADMVSVQLERGLSQTITLTDAQERNLAELMADDPEFFQTEMKVTP